jgi:mono/diheme cytochrome c family protein
MPVERRGQVLSPFKGVDIVKLILMAALAAALQAQPPVPEGNADNGKRLFVSSYCSACHGTMGQGSTAGARIAPRPIAFAAFEKYLRQPTGQMAPYTRAVLPDRDLADIYAYLRSIPQGTPARSIPLLAQ